MDISQLTLRLRQSRLFKDSFWSVFGNGFGSALLLLAGILIARLLGSDLYGEYGVVKSSMFYVASFATLGLGITSTKYVAQYLAERQAYVKALIRDCYVIALSFSGVLALLLVLFGSPLSRWLNSPELDTPFRFLGAIIVVRAINMTQAGILGGLKAYHAAAVNSLWSGVFMLAICYPLTYWWSLDGALVALLASQIANCGLNYLSILKHSRKLENQEEKSFIKELLLFSLPVALQESTYFIGQWGGILLLTKFSSVQQVGLYSAAAQWAAVVLYIPGALYNVVISYLSSNLRDNAAQMRILRIMLTVNIVCTLIPTIVIWLLGGWIASFYGPTFSEMPPVLGVLCLGTVFTCCVSVFRSQFVAHGRNWLMLSIRAIKDVVFLVAAYLLISAHQGENGALYYAWASLITSIVLFLLLLICVIYFNRDAKTDKN